ncbi:uncharacterized protein L201_007653 [Kwoniella dendrophila CBS 6074]|uniref:Uncharacterized protein n=1 Tax=Kwoniella dendrophila CBS 6074 TaxID=1295534 RepID=A0AAX4K6D9_9TREE
MSSNSTTIFRRETALFATKYFQSVDYVVSKYLHTKNNLDHDAIRRSKAEWIRNLYFGTSKETRVEIETPTFLGSGKNKTFPHPRGTDQLWAIRTTQGALEFDKELEYHLGDLGNMLQW